MVTSYIHEQVMNCLVKTDMLLPEHAHHLLLKILKPIYIYNLSISVPLISTLRIDQRFSMDCPGSMDWSSDGSRAGGRNRADFLPRPRRPGESLAENDWTMDGSFSANLQVESNAVYVYVL